MKITNYFKTDKFEEITVVKSYLFGFITNTRRFRLFETMGSICIIEYKGDNTYKEVSRLGDYCTIKNLFKTQR